MEMNDFPILWIGPAGCGKLTAARNALGAPISQSPRLLTLEIGDYQARYWEFPTHMEIDIMDLSMMDKQVLPEMLSQLLNTRDVRNSGKRKLLILRRVHGLSPAAAARVRSALEEFVWSADATATVWMTARVVNGSVVTLMDGFVYKRITISAPDIRKDRLSVIPDADITESSPSLQKYIRQMFDQMVIALEAGPPCLEAIKWIRTRVYEMLGLMVTGSELVASLTWATVHSAAAKKISTEKARKVLNVLAQVRWFPSYRTPLMLELIIVDVYEALI